MPCEVTEQSVWVSWELLRQMGNVMSQRKRNPGDRAAPVFGLSMAQLHPIVEAAAGEPIASFDISIEHQVEGFYGFGGEKAVPTFTYVTSAGCAGRVTVFAKHSNDPESTEAEQCGFLGAHGAPIPRMYGTLRSSAGRPILFFEHVDTSESARSTGSPESLRELLSLMARFNAIRPAPDYAAWLQQASSTREDKAATQARTQELLWEAAQRGDLGDDLRRFCASRQHDLPRIQTFTQRLFGQVVQMETGLVHTDFSRENTGRRSTGERVVMDLEEVTIGPRFTDVSGWLGRPVDLWTRQEDQRDMAEYYLREYSRWGGCPPSLDQCLEESQVLWVQKMIDDLDFGLRYGQEDSSADDDWRNGCRRGLLNNLTRLLDRHC